MAEGKAIEAGSQETAQDDALVRGLRDRTPQACRHLCERFGPRIHRFAAARLAGDGQLAEDVMVQTMVDAMRNITRFNPRRSTLSAWLYGIARRQVQGELRRRGRQKSVPQSAQVPLDSIAESSTMDDVSDDTAVRLDAQRRVAEVADILSDTEFEVLVLNSVDELSAREIGQIIGRSERAIHSLLHRARSKARERLMKDED